MSKNRSDRELVRDLAIIMVDGPKGYTMEFASNPEAHAAEYDEMETTLLSGMELKGFKLVKA